MMTAIRVLPPFDPRGTAVLHGLIGAATALPFWAGRPLAAPTVFISLLPALGVRTTWYASAAGLALPVVMAAWLSLRRPWRWPCLSGPI